MEVVVCPWWRRWKSPPPTRFLVVSWTEACDRLAHKISRDSWGDNFLREMSHASPSVVPVHRHAVFEYLWPLRRVHHSLIPRFASPFLPFYTMAAVLVVTHACHPDFFLVSSSCRWMWKGSENGHPSTTWWWCTDVLG